jgi:molybdopterin biosynthesis enzyme
MLFRIGALPGEPIAAAAAFYGEVIPLLERALIDPLKKNGGHAQAVCADTVPAHDALPRPFLEPPADDSILLVFAPADHTHRAWRLAAVQALALAHVPLRINAVASDEEHAVVEVRRYLSSAPGVTGQYWALDGNGAGEVLS